MNKKLQITFKKAEKPVIAIGFISWNEFIVMVWPLALQIRWGY